MQWVPSPCFVAGRCINHVCLVTLHFVAWPPNCSSLPGGAPAPHICSQAPSLAKATSSHSRRSWKTLKEALRRSGCLTQGGVAKLLVLCWGWRFLRRIWVKVVITSRCPLPTRHSWRRRWRTLCSDKLLLLQLKGKCAFDYVLLCVIMIICNCGIISRCLLSYIYNFNNVILCYLVVLWCLWVNVYI